MQVFTSMALFNILISPLNAFPWVINGLMEAWVSTKRVDAFLKLKELDFAEYYSQSSECGGRTAESSGHRYAESGDKTAESAQRYAESGEIKNRDKNVTRSLVSDKSISLEVASEVFRKPYQVNPLSSGGSDEREGGSAISIRHGCFTWRRRRDVLDEGSSNPSQEGIDGDGGGGVGVGGVQVQFKLADLNLTIRPVCKNCHKYQEMPPLPKVPLTWLEGWPHLWSRYTV